MHRQILSLALILLVAAGCGSDAPDNLQQAGATADANLATVGPAAATVGANAADAAATAAAEAGQAQATVGAAAGGALDTLEARINDRLVARVWQWTETSEPPSSVVTPTDPGVYTITFLPGGSLAVKADCKTAGGTYVAGETSMRLDIKIATTEACLADSLADTFLDELSKVTTWNVEGEFLTLGMADDAGTIKLEAP
jgi:heat shock protein HslJ